MDPVELNERVARLEERMETMKAEYRTDIACLAEDLAKQETRLVFYMIAIVGVGLTVFGFVTA